MKRDNIEMFIIVILGMTPVCLIIGLLAYLIHVLSNR